MNWIEIDKILHGIISRHNCVDDMLEEAMKQFKWSHRQACTAIEPLLNRNTNSKTPVKQTKSRSKRSTNTKKKL